MPQPFGFDTKGSKAYRLSAVQSFEMRASHVHRRPFDVRLVERENAGAEKTDLQIFCLDRRARI